MAHEQQRARCEYAKVRGGVVRDMFTLSGLLSSHFCHRCDDSVPFLGYQEMGSPVGYD